jgi:hypothetical protein
MSHVETTAYGEYVIQAHATPTGHTWAAEYTVLKGGTTKIAWKRGLIPEGLPTHGTAIHAAFDCARADIDHGRFDAPD